MHNPSTPDYWADYQHPGSDITDYSFLAGSEFLSSPVTLRPESPVRSVPTRSTGYCPDSPPVNSILLHNFTSSNAQVFGESFAKRDEKREKYALVLLEASRRCGDMEIFKMSQKIKLCCQEVIGFRCQNDGFLRIVPRNYCYVPGCPHCDRNKSSRLAHDALLLVALMNFPRVLNLTVQHSAGESLDDVWKRLNRGVRDFRRTKAYKKHVTSSISYQQTSNKGLNGWHPHMHSISDCEWWELEDLNRTWASVGGGTCHISEISEGTIRDLVHYTTRGSGIFDDPDRALEYIRCKRGRRLSTPTGALYGVKTQIKKLKDIYKASHDSDDFKAARKGFFRFIKWRTLNGSDEFTRLLSRRISFEPSPVNDCPVCGDRMTELTLGEWNKYVPRPLVSPDGSVEPDGFVDTVFKPP